MSRYIDADRLKKHFEWWESEAKAKEFKEIFDEIIDAQPTADVVERESGKWTEREVIEDGKAIEEWQSARCSVCGKYHTTPYMYYFDDFAYCPNCGAEMNERREDGEVH